MSMTRRARWMIAAGIALLIAVLLIAAPRSGSNGGPTASPSDEPNTVPLTGVESNPGLVVLGQDAKGAAVAEIIVAIRNVGSTSVVIDPLRSSFDLTDASGAVVGEGRFLFVGPTLLSPGARGYLIGIAKVNGTPTAGAARNVAYTETTAGGAISATGGAIGRNALTVDATLSAPGMAIAICYDAQGNLAGAVGGEGSGRLTLSLPDFVPANRATRCELFAGPAPAR